MANEKILDVTYPGITSWQWHATLFSILGNDENARKFHRNLKKLKFFDIILLENGEKSFNLSQNFIAT